MKNHVSQKGTSIPWGRHVLRVWVHATHHVDVLPLLVTMPAVWEEVSGWVSCVAVGTARIRSIAVLLRVVGTRVQVWRWRYVWMWRCNRSTTTGTRGEQETSTMLQQQMTTAVRLVAFRGRQIFTATRLRRSGKTVFIVAAIGTDNARLLFTVADDRRT
jgi:hypothetical protein